jgi:hypothetical protein
VERKGSCPCTDIPTATSYRYSRTSSYRYSIDAFNCNAASWNCSAGDHEWCRSSDQCPQLQKWNGRVVAHVPIFPPRRPTDIPSTSSYRYSIDAFNCNVASCDCSAGDHEWCMSLDQCPQLQKWNGRVVAHVPIFPPRRPTDIPSTSSYRYSIDAFNCNVASCDCSAGDHEWCMSLDQCPQLQKWNGRVVAHVPIFPLRRPTDIPTTTFYCYSID